MKKLLSLCVVITFAAGFATAQEGVGLTVGLEFGIGDINKPEQGGLSAFTAATRSMPPPLPEVRKPYLQPFIGYENNFFDSTLDVAAKLAYDIGLYKSDFTYDFYKSLHGAAFYRFAAIGEKKNPQNLYSDFMLGYNLRLGDASTLSVIVENNNSFVLVPQTDGGSIGVIRPGIKFNQHFDGPGDFHIQTDFPVAYRHLKDKGDAPMSGLDLTLGWASTFGLGVKATGHILFTPNDKALFPPGIDERPRAMIEAEEFALTWAPEEAHQAIRDLFQEIGGPRSNIPPTNGLTGISLAITYENGPIYGEVALTTPTKIYGLLYSWFETTPDYGMVITPMFQYTFIPGLAAYASLKIDGLFARVGKRVVDPGLTPAIGVKYSF